MGFSASKGVSCDAGAILGRINKAVEKLKQVSNNPINCQFFSPKIRPDLKDANVGQMLPPGTAGNVRGGPPQKTIYI